MGNSFEHNERSERKEVSEFCRSVAFFSHRVGSATCPQRLTDHVPFSPMGQHLGLKCAPTGTGPGGTKHTPTRMKGKAKRRYNGKMSASTSCHPHEIHNTFTATRTPTQHRTLTQGSSCTGSPKLHHTQATGTSFPLHKRRHQSQQKCRRTTSPTRDLGQCRGWHCLSMDTSTPQYATRSCVIEDHMKPNYRN